jgi:hypothetical protein
MRNLYLLLLIGIGTSLMQAQSENDALRYSFLTHGGTARYIGMSGAFGALGADFSSISTNPAGVGSFRSNSIMFSPIYQMNSTEADYKDKTSSTDKISLNLNNAGLVINLNSSGSDGTGWKNIAVGFGYNKLKSFNQDVAISGFNRNSSRLDQFMLNSDGLDTDKLYSAEYAIYDVYLIDRIPNNPDMLYTHPYYGKYYINQKKKTSTKGGVGEYVIAFGGNYNDVVQIGISMGIQNVRYTEKSIFSESSDSTDLRGFEFTENLNTKGAGINFKLGMIYRPVEFIRIGAAFHSPTFFTLTDIYSYQASSDFRTPDSNGNSSYESDGDGEMDYNYEIYTPMRIVGSAALVFPKIGILSADYEFTKYNKARLRADDYDFIKENNTIKEIYQTGHNVRLGAEIRLSPLYLRGGVSYYGSPDKQGYISDIKSFSAGAGVRTKQFFADFGYTQSLNSVNSRLYEYESGGEERANLKFNNSMAVVTFGFVF